MIGIGLADLIMLVMFLASGLLVAALAVVPRRWWRADDARPA